MPLTFPRPSPFNNDPYSFQKSYLDSFIDDYMGSNLSEPNKKTLIRNIQSLSLEPNLLKKFFFKALLKKDFDIVSALINAKKIDVDTVDENGNTALFYSSELNDLRMAGLLLENGANVNFKNAQGNTPLIQAAMHSNVAMLNLLLSSYGALIDDKNLEGSSALMYAISTKNYQNAKALILKNANVDDSDNQGITILMEAILQMGPIVDESDLEIIESILEKTQNVNAQDSFGETALMKNKNVQIAKKLLIKQASLSIKNREGQTPLLIAARHGLDDLIILYMLSGDANIEDVDHEGYTALMLASTIKDNISTIKTLLRYCSRRIINHRNSMDLTALKIAIYARNIAAITTLIKAGALFDDIENFDVSMLNLRDLQVLSRPDGSKTVTMLWETQILPFYLQP
ncbi:MAG: Phosphocholine transferase AnkX [Candidatus Anoxychlamydiales bacterium]|nr:Phosphocholine transferase AnkX [Candidatus Anoxychlamydiales bacterium]